VLQQCCSVLQCVAVCCSVLCTSDTLQHGAKHAACCIVLQRVAVCCRQRVAVCCSVHLIPLILLVAGSSNARRVAGRTEWQRPTGCLKLQVSCRKRATNYRALLREMIYKDKASYASLPPCSNALRAVLCVLCCRQQVVWLVATLDYVLQQPTFCLTATTHEACQFDSTDTECRRQSHT